MNSLLDYMFLVRYYLKMLRNVRTVVSSTLLLLACLSYEIPLRYKTWGAWGATSQKFASKLDQAAGPELAAGSPALVLHIISGVFGMHIFVSCF